jgi:hypothetical protein
MYGYAAKKKKAIYIYIYSVKGLSAISPRLKSKDHISRYSPCFVDV